MKTVIFALILSFICQTTGLAIEAYEAEPFIGKEVTLCLYMELKNSKKYFELEGLVLDVVEIIGYDYLALYGGYSKAPIMIPCDNIEQIRKREF